MQEFGESDRLKGAISPWIPTMWVWVWVWVSKTCTHTHTHLYPYPQPTVGTHTHDFPYSQSVLGTRSLDYEALQLSVPLWTLDYLFPLLATLDNDVFGMCTYLVSCAKAESKSLERGMHTHSLCAFACSIGHGVVWPRCVVHMHTFVDTISCVYYAFRPDPYQRLIHCIGCLPCVMPFMPCRVYFKWPHRYIVPSIGQFLCPQMVYLVLGFMASDACLGNASNHPPWYPTIGQDDILDLRLQRTHHNHASFLIWSEIWCTDPGCQSLMPFSAWAGPTSNSQFWPKPWGLGFSVGHKIGSATTSLVHYSSLPNSRTRHAHKSSVSPVGVNHLSW